MKKTSVAYRVTLLLLLAAVLYLIFGASSQDGDTSGMLSAWATGLINTAVTGAGLPLSITEHFIRKAAHFSEYAVMGALLLLNLRAWMTVRWGQAAWALFPALLIPVLDEFSQTFVPGRTGSPRDVLIDFCGAIVGMGIVVAVTALRGRGKRTRQGTARRAQ